MEELIEAQKSIKPVHGDFRGKKTKWEAVILVIYSRCRFNTIKRTGKVESISDVHSLISSELAGLTPLSDIKGLREAAMAYLKSNLQNSSDLKNKLEDLIVKFPADDNEQNFPQYYKDKKEYLLLVYYAFCGNHWAKPSLFNEIIVPIPKTFADFVKGVWDANILSGKVTMNQKLDLEDKLLIDLLSINPIKLGILKKEDLKGISVKDFSSLGVILKPEFWKRLSKTVKKLILRLFFPLIIRLGCPIFQIDMKYYYFTLIFQLTYENPFQAALVAGNIQ
jgi:hypothetical protein